jgi:hypothetical protein
MYIVEKYKFYFYQQCMYIVFIQYQKVQSNCQILLKKAETGVI